MIPKNVKLEVGDLVDCQFHLLRFEGVIMEISDGSENNMPGELMYLTEIPGQGKVWLKRYELLHKLDPDGAFRDAVQVYTRRQLMIARVKFNTAIAKIVAQKVQESQKFRGRL